MKDEGSGRAEKKSMFFKISAVVVLAAFILAGSFFYPVMTIFIAITALIVFIIMFLSKKIFGFSFDDYREEKEAYCITDIADLEDIKSVLNIPLPFVVTDQDGYILLYNNLFKGLFDFETSNRNIEELLGKIDLHVNKQHGEIGNVPYDVYCAAVTDNKIGRRIFTVCLVNTFEREHIKWELRDKMPVVGLMYIDNYDELTESADDAQIPLLTALIDRKLNAYISGFGGILKKFEKDRFIFVMENDALNRAKEKKFEIINSVKETKVGDHIPVTLSIGVGVNEDGLDASMKNAREAIELALGRGGDQALIKDKEKYQFFGGKSGEVSHNAKIRARVKADALEGLIADASEVLIMGHKIPDFDSLGAAVGMSRIVKSCGKIAGIVMDNPSKGIQAVYDMLIGIEEQKGLFLDSRTAIEILNDKTLLVVVDTYIPSLVESVDVLKQAKKIVVFDHHRKSAEYIENAVLIYHEPYASSTSELVTEVIRHMDDKVKLRQEEADALLSGITVDTKSFSVKTGTTTFEAAAYLRRNGADSVRVKEFFRNEINDFKIKAKTVGGASLYKGGIIIAKCEYEEEGISVICAQAADELLEISGVKASVVLSEMYGKIYISSRSLGDVNVQMLMEKIGGGGHRIMAGAQLENMSLDEACERVKEAIDEYLEEDK